MRYISKRADKNNRKIKKLANKFASKSKIENGKN